MLCQVEHTTVLGKGWEGGCKVINRSFRFRSDQTKRRPDKAHWIQTLSFIAWRRLIRIFSCLATGSVPQDVAVRHWQPGWTEPGNHYCPLLGHHLSGWFEFIIRTSFFEANLWHANCLKVGLFFCIRSTELVWHVFFLLSNYTQISDILWKIAQQKSG